MIALLEMMKMMGMDKSTDSNDLVKVELNGPDGEVETLWAKPLVDNRYELDNTPFYAYGVSWQDIIEAQVKHAGQFPVFVKVVRKSGNRTVRIIFEKAEEISDDNKQVLDGLVKMGCSYEGAFSKLMAINIPPKVDLKQVCDFLTSSESQWEYADPTYEEVQQKQDYKKAN